MLQHQICTSQDSKNTVLVDKVFLAVLVSKIRGGIKSLQKQSFSENNIVSKIQPIFS